MRSRDREQKYLQAVVKSAFVNLFRIIWMCYIFSVIPMPTRKCKKEDLHGAGKTPGLNKTYFCKEDKNY